MGTVDILQMESMVIRVRHSANLILSVHTKKVNDNTDTDISQVQGNQRMITEEMHWNGRLLTYVSLNLKLNFLSNVLSALK